MIFIKKTVLITGASKGIGSETARLFAQNGYNVVINYNKSKNEALCLLNELIKITDAIAVGADVSVSTEVCRMVRQAEDKFNRIDVLVNNAGIAYTNLFDLTGDEAVNQIIDTNLKGTLYTSRAVLPGMIRNKNGSIINISSIWGITGASCEVVYSASKAGIIGFTKALAKEVGPSGITVNCVAPGVINTDMNKNLSPDDLSALKEETPLNKIGTCADIAQAILYLAQASYITGQVLSPNGGLVI